MDWKNTRQSFLTALIWVAVAGLAFVLWQVRMAVLLAFGAIVVAILLNVFASLISDWTRIPQKLGLAIATSLVVVVVGLMFWRFGSELSSQFTELMQHVEGGSEHLRAMFQNSGLGKLSTEFAVQGTSLIAGVMSNAVAAGLQFAESAVIVAVSAVYLAAEPQLYRRGIAMLFRPQQRPRIIRSADLIGRTLKLWLLGQLVLMAGVAILTFIAVWLIGLPTPAALALLAGLAEIVPYIGPFLSAIPALLVALTLGVAPALWTAAAYLAIHIVEGYVSAPLTQRYFVTIPPALILTGIVAADLLFGTIGIILAAPITIVIYMAVKMAYVDDPLEEGEKLDERLRRSA